MNRTIVIPQFLAFVAHVKSGDYDSVVYVPAHTHSPGDDIPCSASWLMIL